MILKIFIHTNVIQQLSYLYPYNAYYPYPPIPTLPIFTSYPYPHITHSIHIYILSNYFPVTNITPSHIKLIILIRQLSHFCPYIPKLFLFSNYQLLSSSK